MTAQPPAAPESSGCLCAHVPSIPGRPDVSCPKCAPAAPETDVSAVVDLLAAHRYMPCAHHTPTINAWWSQCEGCDWRGPRRSQRHSDEADHRLHLATVVAEAAREHVRVVEDERDAAVDRLCDGLHKWREDAEHYRARAESAEAALAEVRAGHWPVLSFMPTLCVCPLCASVVLNDEGARQAHAAWHGHSVIPPASTDTTGGVE